LLTGALTTVAICSLFFQPKIEVLPPNDQIVVIVLTFIAMLSAWWIVEAALAIKTVTSVRRRLLLTTLALLSTFLLLGSMGLMAEIVRHLKASLESAFLDFWLLEALVILLFISAWRTLRKARTLRQRTDRHLPFPI
jgi:hypothetical protein